MPSQEPVQQVGLRARSLWVAVSSAVRGADAREVDLGEFF